MTGMDEARDLYMEKPVNFGPDDASTRLAERDAFAAGWEAATEAFITGLAVRMKQDPFVEQAVRRLAGLAVRSRDPLEVVDTDRGRGAGPDWHR